MEKWHALCRDFPPSKPDGFLGTTHVTSSSDECLWGHSLPIISSYNYPRVAADIGKKEVPVV